MLDTPGHPHFKTHKERKSTRFDFHFNTKQGLYSIVRVRHRATFNSLFDLVNHFLVGSCSSLLSARFAAASSPTQRSAEASGGVSGRFDSEGEVAKRAATSGAVGGGCVCVCVEKCVGGRGGGEKWVGGGGGVPVLLSWQAFPSSSSVPRDRDYLKAVGAFKFK